MFENNKDIVAGDGSTNIQGKNVNITNHGLGYLEVKEVAMDVFKSNFYDLGEKVTDLINERAEELLGKFLDELREKSPESLIHTEDPDVRYAIFEAQKSHARLGVEEISDLLVDALIERTLNNSDQFLKIVLNEALSIIPKLTVNQINTLSYIYLIRYLSFKPELKIPIGHYLGTLYPFINKIEIQTSEMSFQHLQYTGCLSISIGSSSFDSIMLHKFSYIFNGNESELATFVNANADLLKLKNKWDNTKLCNSTLTSVGLAIAIININEKMGYKWELGIWIN